MPSPDPIILGRDKSAPFVAFGDDSQFRNVLVYAFVVVHRPDLPKVAARLTLLKEWLHIPLDVQLHCRVLFNKDQREKAGLGHIGIDQLHGMLRRAVRIMNQCRVTLRYSWMDLEAYRKAVPFGDGKIALQGQEKDEWADTPFVFDPKGFQGILATSCWTIVQDGTQGPTAEQCEIFIGEDATKVQFLGDRRRRADRWASGFLDISTAAGPVRIEPAAMPATGHPLMQLADIAAYMCSHGVNQSGFFRQQLDSIRYWTRGVMQYDVPPT